MRRSNRNFNIPLGKPRAFDYLLCPGSGEFDLCRHGVGKIEPEVSGLNESFSGTKVANSHKTLWTRWKRYSICERLAYNKGLQKLGTDRQI